MLFLIIFIIVFSFLKSPKGSDKITPKDIRIQNQLLSNIENKTNDKILSLELDRLGIKLQQQDKNLRQ